ncbi:MAG: tail fiber domain-containing protein [Bacteroidetes bacterium]|nr:tail fiber domain-containing protein [Bacteroidota bacterium]
MTALSFVSVLLLLLCSFSLPGFAQVGIGTTAPDAKAILHLKLGATPRGLLLPQLDTPDRTGSLQAGLGMEHIGLLVADTNQVTGGLYVWSGVGWVNLTQDPPPLWERTGSYIHPYNLADRVAIGTAAPQNMLDVAAGARSGAHPTDRPFYVSGVAGLGAGVEFRTADAAQGIGIGNNVLYAAGTNPDQELSVAAKGAGGLSFVTNNATRLKVTGGGNVGIGVEPATTFHVGKLGTPYVDQAQSTYNSFTADTRAQSFRAGVSGPLVGIEFLMSGNPGDMFTFQIHAGENPSSPNPLMAPQVVTSTTGGINWQYATLSTPVMLTAGQDYHVVLTLVSGIANYAMSTANPYPNGRFFYYFGFWNPFSSTDDLAFRTYMGTKVDILSADGPSGNVGIATAAPTHTLHIAGNMRLQDGTEAAGYLLQSDALGVATWVNPAALMGPQVWTSGVGTAYLTTSSDKIGIGNSTPGHRVHIGDATSDAQLVCLRVLGNEPSAWKGGAAFGYTSASVIMGQLNGVATIGGHSSNLDAWTNLAINPGGGNVGIGTFFPTERLHVVGNILADGYLYTSDRRYKDHIMPIPNALAAISRLNGVYYDWRIAEFPHLQFPQGRQLGVIAQEVETLFPEAVHTGTDGYKTVDYIRLIPVLLQAVKEHKTQTDREREQLMRMVQDLADQNRDLQLRLQALEGQALQGRK